MGFDSWAPCSTPSSPALLLGRIERYARTMSDPRKADNSSGASPVRAVVQMDYAILEDVGYERAVEALTVAADATEGVIPEPPFTTG